MLTTCECSSAMRLAAHLAALVRGRHRSAAANALQDGERAGRDLAHCVRSPTAPRPRRRPRGRAAEVDRGARSSHRARARPAARRSGHGTYGQVSTTESRPSRAAARSASPRSRFRTTRTRRGRRRASEPSRQTTTSSASDLASDGCAGRTARDVVERRPGARPPGVSRSTATATRATRPRSRRSCSPRPTLVDLDAG